MTRGFLTFVFSFGMLAAGAQAQPCDLKAYKPADGLTAQAAGDGVILNWQGEAGAQLRAQFAIRDGKPWVGELAVQEQEGAWATLARNVTPDFQVTTAKRRLSTAQLHQMKQFHDDTPSEIERRQWNAFWDDPLVVPGGGTNSAFLPRKPDEIRRDVAAFHSTACKVTSQGARESVSFDGLTLGIFSGELTFTVYKGSNLLRQEAIAKTDAPDVAFIYKAGLKGLAIGADTKLVWRDTARAWQKYEFGGATNTDPVDLRARNRLEILDTGDGSLAVFPPPHKFFFARENEVNLGYVYYRKDDAASFSLGVMQPERSEGYHPWGVNDAVWTRRTGVSHSEWENYALYNAPPGTLQHMAVYYYLSGKKPEAAQAAVLAYTHNDVFKPVPGFKVLTGHFHLDFNEMLSDQGSMDYQPQWVPVFRGLGVNIVYLGDFHDDSHPNDPGPIRFKEEKVYFEGAQRVSDKDFLVMPAEEPNVFLGGHWYLLTPKPVYFSHAVPRPAGQQFIENDPVYGQVYHLGSAQDVLEMVNREKGLIWTAHPHTKNSEEYPDRYKDQDFFQSDRFLGASWESLPTDLSQKRLCEIRCFDLGDEMSNWAPKPKFLIAEGDTYTKWPDDETYPLLAVNYLKLDRVPRYDESWAPIIEGLRAGNFFGTTGEVLFHDWSVEGQGKHGIYNAEIEYTYPLEFAELVWSDGKKVDRKFIDLTDTLPFGIKKFAIPFDATGKKWVRFAVWDSAGNGAWIQPVALK
ncbi:MAG TPA: hypothetical protein VHV26_03125 [Rhizomicrobium sp.]|nr:hypothetical protein [Rhizomicrobium sp.]